MSNTWYTRMNFRWTKALNVRSEIIKIVEDDMGGYFYNARMEMTFPNMIHI